MSASNDPKHRFENHHQHLIDAFIEHRDAVLNPNQEFTLDDLIGFLEGELLPHATHEEKILYQRVDEETGTEIATASLREDHTEIEHRIDPLAEDEMGGASLPLLLHELSALIIHHFQKEEDVLLPYLERTLDEDEFNALFEMLLAHDDT